MTRSDTETRTVGENQYRYYNEEELLALQQILFFRELGFELKKIRSIVSRSGFDRIEALQAHREVLLKERMPMGKLIATIDHTLDKLKGGNRMKSKMKDSDLYQGFAPEKQAEYEEYIKNRFGVDNEGLDRVPKERQEIHQSRLGEKRQGVGCDLPRPRGGVSEGRLSSLGACASRYPPASQMAQKVLDSEASVLHRIGRRLHGLRVEESF
jgi:DNA-binding transcriptional MerR regulator